MDAAAHRRHLATAQPWGYLRQVTFWWLRELTRPGQPLPDLTVVAERLDGRDAAVRPTRLAGGWGDDRRPFVTAALDLPSPGCWRISAAYDGEDVSYVVRVDAAAR